MTFLLLAVSMPARAIEIPYRRVELDNGLVVLLHEDHSLPQVTVNVWYGVGSKDEPEGRTGFAHLFEHLMFMGTERVPGSGFDDAMEAHGGWNNAWTAEDATDYYSVGPSNLLPLLIWLDADRMDALGRAMTQEKLDLQRDVVRNERRQSYEDAPYGEAWLALSEALYPPGHPYAHPVIGTHEDLEAATLDDVRAFFDRFYVPANAGLVVAGDFDPDEVLPWIRQTFGRIPRRPAPEHRTAPPVDRPNRALVELTDQVSLPRTFMAWHTPAAFQPGDAEMDVVAAVLARGRSSRLYRRFVHDEGLADEVDAAQWSQMLGSVFLVTATPAAGHTVEEVEAAIQAEIDRLAAEGPTPEELERARNQLRADFLRGLESLHARATALNRYRYLVGDPGYVDEDLRRTDEATADPERIRRAAARLSAERRAVVRVRPEEADR